MNTEAWITAIVAIAGSLFASSGLWALILKRYELKHNQEREESESEKAQRRVLMGLAHDRIVHLCMVYISRGEITKDEYEDLHHYLWEPYKDIGGNGSAEKMMREVERLKLTKETYPAGRTAPTPPYGPRVMKEEKDEN